MAYIFFDIDGTLWDEDSRKYNSNHQTIAEKRT